MNRQQLIHTIREKKSFLCVGLDTDPDKMPEPFRHEPDGIFQFNRAIIDDKVQMRNLFEVVRSTLGQKEDNSLQFVYPRTGMQTYCDLSGKAFQDAVISGHFAIR